MYGEKVLRKMVLEKKKVKRAEVESVNKHFLQDMRVEIFCNTH